MKNGFTLIELLAVILILGVIALIAIPTVTDVINEAKVGAEQTTANNLANQAGAYLELCQIRNDNECILDFTSLTDDAIKDVLNIKGDIPRIDEIERFDIVDNEVNLIYTRNGITCTVTSSSNATCDLV